MSTNVTKMTRYTARWAARSDFSKVAAVYRPKYVDEEGRPHDRPNTVFERTHKATADAIEGERTLLLIDDKGQIKLLASLHILSVVSEIAKTIGAPGREVSAVNSAKLIAGEIGGVYRPGDGPSGFCMELVYDALILQALKKARECTINLLTTQIVANNQQAIEKLIKLQQGWEQCAISEGYAQQFKATIVDPVSRETELASYYTDPAIAVRAAAHSILGLSGQKRKFDMSDEYGVIRAKDRSSDKMILIDMRPTGLLEIAEGVAFKSASQNTSPHASWAEVNSALLHPVTSAPSSGRPPSRSRRITAAAAHA